MAAACTAERRSTSWSDQAPSIILLSSHDAVEKMACEAKPSQGNAGQTTNHILSLIIAENCSIAYPHDAR